MKEKQIVNGWEGMCREEICVACEMKSERWVKERPSPANADE